MRCCHCWVKQASSPSVQFPVIFMPQKSFIPYWLSVIVPKTATGDDRSIEPFMLTMPSSCMFSSLVTTKAYWGFRPCKTSWLEQTCLREVNWQRYIHHKKFGIIISLILFKEQGRPDQAQTHESSTAPNRRVKAFKTGIDSDNPSVNLVVS